jgi:hypothetical protein
MAYDNTNRGSVWANKKKRPDKQDADFTGSLNVNGVEYWVNAWKRKDGASRDAPALSFSIRAKDGEGVEPKKVDPISSGRLLKEDMDDDIPFSAEFR